MLLTEEEASQLEGKRREDPMKTGRLWAPFICVLSLQASGLAFTAGHANARSHTSHMHQ